MSQNNKDNLIRPYLLLTPGPLTTSMAVKEAMLADWCTWDNEYNSMVQQIRSKLVALVVNKAAEQNYTSVLMQGSGTFSVEAVIGTVIPRDGKLLVISNGAYGTRIKQIAEILHVEYIQLDYNESSTPNLDEIDAMLQNNSSITHAAVVHCETTSGILNPIEEIAKIVKKHKKAFIVDAMSSFGGIEIHMDELEIDFLISSSNKCIQGVPGFGFVIARKEILEKCSGQARSLSLNLYEQWREMEDNHGKWRFTSPTHTVHAFSKALEELEHEGGVKARYSRYVNNNRVLIKGMAELGIKSLLEEKHQSPIITSFYYPDAFAFDFNRFYTDLKSKGFVIYPGKISNADTFRIGNIGEVYEQDIRELLHSVQFALNQQNQENIPVL